jgi:hypothetical protein
MVFSACAMAVKLSWGRQGEGNKVQPDKQNKRNNRGLSKNKKE